MTASGQNDGDESVPLRRFFKRHELRQKEALPILSAMKAWLDKSILTVAPKSAIGKAIAYSFIAESSKRRGDCNIIAA
jgi:hypothetical protein